MVVFPNCKINLGLSILQKRIDGYHELETVFYPLPVYDALEVIRSSGSTSFTATGLPIPGLPAEQQLSPASTATNHNLCLRAHELLKRPFPDLPPVHVHLHKAIPIGAGLGGGSADGAFMLRLLNDEFRLGIDQQALIGYALELGSDAPFFIINRPCSATGRGEKMQPIELDLSSYRWQLVNPGIHVNTGEAFRLLNRGESTKHRSPSPRDIVQQPIDTWKDQLVNDFEAPVFDAHPEIAAIKARLYTNGASYASMTGSGSSVFGLFDRSLPIVDDFNTHYMVRNF